MNRAWISGRSVSLEDAVTQAALVLGRSRQPVVAGLGADIEGTRAAVALAARLSGAVDHMHSSALLRDIDCARETEVMVTTPTEARAHADLLLLVGSDLEKAWPDLFATLCQTTPTSQDETIARRLIWICPDRQARRADFGGRLETLGQEVRQALPLIACLRARVNGRNSNPVGTAAKKKIDQFATLLRSAKFGVAVWSAQQLDDLTIEMLNGLVRDLNAETQFTSLPLAAQDNAAGVLTVCGWMTGFPMRTGFGRGFAEHDPWRFDAKRLVESGEADCALWISAYRSVAPDWQVDLPIVALTGESTIFRRPPDVQIEVGRPGIDHASIGYLAQTGTLAAIGAGLDKRAHSVADIVGQIVQFLPDSNASPC